MPLDSLERVLWCPCREPSSCTVTLLVRWRFEVLVVISCVSWLLVIPIERSIPYFVISVLWCKSVCSLIPNWKWRVCL